MQTKNKKYTTDFRPEGVTGPRVRKTFDKKKEATDFETHTRSKVLESKPWGSQKLDSRRLDELVDLWYTLYGNELSDGERRKNILMHLSASLKNPVASRITKQDFSEYRVRRRSQNNISKNTVNHEHAYLCALFNKLIELGEWHHDNPIKGMKKFKLAESELRYLEHEEIIDLFREMKTSRSKCVSLISEICLSTGARWGEAERLRVYDVKNNRITYTNTNDGKKTTKSKKNRTIPIPEALFNKIKAKIRDNKASGLQGERIFNNSIGAFRKAIDRANIYLPKGQMTHVLRHSFASHFMMNNGNILTLKEILGHSDIKMTMIYAQLAPKYLVAATTLNPMSALDIRPLEII